MKNAVKKWTGLILIFVVFSAFKVNQEPCTRIEKMSQWMKDSLGLSEPQLVKINAINDSTCVKIKAIKSSSTGDREADKSKVHAVMKSTVQEYKLVLTDQQFEKLKQHRKAMNENGKKKEKIH